MEPKSIGILGSTGSIGRSALDVITAHPGRFEVKVLAAHSNVELLEEQYFRFRPETVCVVDCQKAPMLETKLKGEPVEVLSGEEALVKAAGSGGLDLVLNAVVGSAGLKASLAAVEFGTDLALANKESLVAGGPLFPSLLKKSGANILPVDSEHSAVWQALAAGKEPEIKKIILTASGGPFRDLPMEKMASVTVEQALDHPTWKMGPKITIDSSTLVNKGLEVIEAVVLFSVPAEKVQVVVHPQSIVHSMVEYIDSSIIAQLSSPDMRLPISYALFWPERVESDFGRLDLTQSHSLTFEAPDFERFPALKIAYQVADVGGTAPAVFNAANEEAVAAFLDRRITYMDITEMISRTLDELEIVTDPDLNDILAADDRARKLCRKHSEAAQC